MKSKIDPPIVVNLTPTTHQHNNANHLPKKNIEYSLKKEPISGNIMDIAVTAKVEVVNQDGKITMNNSVHLCKENTSHTLMKVTTSSKETLPKADTAKAKLTHDQFSSHVQILKIAKKPLILNKGNRIMVPTTTKTGNMTTECQTKRQLTTILVTVDRKSEEKIEAATVKVPYPGATKRKHVEVNGLHTKNKKTRVEDGKSTTHIYRIEASKNTLPKKPQEKAIPVTHTMQCMPQMVYESQSLKSVPINRKSPPKVAVETIKHEPEDEDYKFRYLVPKFDALFAQYHEPATALATHIVDLQLSEGSNWSNVPCPDLAWCQSRFDAVVREPRITTPQTTLAALTDFSELCAADDMCHVESVAGGGFICVVVTALMRRNASTNPGAATINYVLPYLGTTSQLFLVMCDSEGGGLPLSIMITSDKTPGVLAPAVRLLAKHANLSPRLWLVPDVPALRDAFVEEFPDASVGLSLSLLLKDSWQYALRETSRIPETHQVLLYQYVVHLIECPSELDLLYQLKVALGSPSQERDTFCEYLNGVYLRRNEWAVYLRDPAFREASLETEVGVTKASVFARLYDFDTVHLVHFAITRLDKWYEHRVRAVHSGTHIDYPITTATMPTDVKLTTLSEGIKLVQLPSEGVEHLVNDIVGVCSCLKGNAGWCRHQLAVRLAAKVDVVRLVPLDHEESVQVDTSMPDIIPSVMLAEPRGSGIWGPAAVEGKRVRKLPPKLKVDLGAFGAPKKQKGEKKEKKTKVEDLVPVLQVEDRRSVTDSVSVQVVEKVAVKGKSKPKQSVSGRVPVIGLEVDHVFEKVHVKKTVLKSDRKKQQLPGKRARVPVNFRAENFGETITEEENARETLVNGSLRGKKVVWKRLSDSTSSPSKTVRFSPVVQKKSTSLPGEEKGVLKLIKLIKRDLSMCFTLNPSLKENICELYQAMYLPVIKPQSILKQTLQTDLPLLPPVNVLADEQKVKVEVVESFCSGTDIDMSNIADIVGVVNCEETVEEIAPADEIASAEEIAPGDEIASIGKIVPACSDILIQCFVPLNALDIEKYRLPDGSYLVAKNG